MSPIGLAILDFVYLKYIGAYKKNAKKIRPHYKTDKDIDFSFI